ncbi:phospholipid/cholesterol/gamma-HCH transport system substrate-binding protein [Marinobacter daqiaonensis]|uniref:Phospholipid/cholesterol/gamma-HCH transport system substrate-binding protein n=1 Tax=Marinobacter daqiaonensis TaxID=650891 RepID=A0A1I6GNE5_9GAMM|nr:MlaD family protein [Marinobacter daqiaonensis]SFR43745.1 phospholipid/cholesterol/gamma-HCH transport system substrate-binding protein [Marinobacter daqiaonensis]
MEPRAHHVLIGIFTVVTLAAILLFALWLGDADKNRQYSYYMVIFHQGVTGLSEGSPVQYSGLEVGNVVSLRLDPEDPRQVQALIRVYSEVPVKKDTRASLMLVNVTGAMSIQLFGGTPESPVLKGSREDPPRIEAEPSQFSTLLSSSENLFRKANSFLDSANQLLSEDNRMNFALALENLRVASEGLVAERENLNQALNAIQQAAHQAEAGFERYNQLAGDIDTLLQDDARAVLLSARDAADALNRATTRIDGLIDANEGALDQGLRSVGEMGPVMQQLQGTLRNLNRLSQRLEEDPARALLGKDPIQEISP